MIIRSNLSQSDSRVRTFEREARRPDGSSVKVGFSLAFARDKAAPQCGFMTCQQYYPEKFWNPIFQVHANGAKGVAGVVLVAENPSDHHIFLSAFTGEGELHSTSTGLRVPTPRGEIQVMAPTAFRDQFGEEAPDIAQGARLAAVRCAVGNIKVAADALAKGGLSSKTCLGGIVIGAKAAFGTTLVFEQEHPTGR